MTGRSVSHFILTDTFCIAVKTISTLPSFDKSCASRPNSYTLFGEIDRIEYNTQFYRGLIRSPPRGTENRRATSIQNSCGVNPRSIQLYQAIPGLNNRDFNLNTNHLIERIHCIRAEVFYGPFADAIQRFFVYPTSANRGSLASAHPKPSCISKIQLIHPEKNFWPGS